MADDYTNAPEGIENTEIVPEVVPVSTEEKTGTPPLTPDQQRQQMFEQQIAELEVSTEATAAILNGLIGAIQNTKPNSQARLIVIQNVSQQQQTYYNNKCILAGMQILKHFEGDMMSALRTLEQVVMKVTSPLTLISADGFDKGTGKKVI